LYSSTAQLIALWPLAVYSAAVIVLVVGMLVLSYLLGQRHQERATGEPYESGIVSTGSARLRFSAKFYLIAMLFVIFDLEAVFIFAWAVAVRELGWAGYLGALVFIGVLVAALIYEWRVGALDWGGGRRKTSAGIDQSPKIGDAASRQTTERQR
jgi:NADH-quinone oxidoreductase subunit A